MKLIDTHIHIWDLDKGDYPWLEGDASILHRNYELKELDGARRKVGVSSGVLVQAADNLQDTKRMLAAAGASDWITGVVGWLPLDDPETTARILEGSWGPGREKGEFGQECSLLKGVRYLIHNQADSGWLLREPVMESLGLLAARDIPYDVVGVKPAHIKTALKVAERLPGLRMVFDHLNRPTIITEPKPDSLWERLMKEAARHENFYVKLSGLGTIAGKGEAWTAEDIEPCIELALRYFGPDRIFCGGDWPVSLLAGSYERTWDAYIGIIEKYADLDMRRKIFHENAERFYGLP